MIGRSAELRAGCVADRSVDALMSRRLLAVRGNESLPVAWELMQWYRIHHLPVVAPDGRCTGIIDAETVAAEWDASTPARARRSVSELLRGRRTPRVYRSDSARVAARAMAANGLDAVPVTDSGGRLVGLVTARDFVAALAGMDSSAIRPSIGLPLFPATRPAETRAPQLPPD